MSVNNNDSIQLKIDGRSVVAHQGETILDAASREGISIPTLCHDPRLAPVGACRTCLVEIDGQRRLQPSCSFKVTDGMKITTESDRITKHRAVLTSLYLADHPGKTTGDDRLQELASTQPGLLNLSPVHSERMGRPAETNPYFDFDPDLCIVCARCTRYCDEVEGVSAITLAERGSATTIATASQISLMESSCELCGGCVDTCPTDALSLKRTAPNTDKIRSTCNYCGVGCQLDINVTNDKVVNITSPEPGTTLNDGNLCIKGRFAFDFINHPDRFTTPLVRDENGILQATSWPVAIAVAAKGLLGVKERHGKEALGFISSSRCTGEENYLMQKLARAAFGTNNCHQCAAT